MKILIKNGRVVDPANNLDAIMDVLVENSTIAKVGRTLEAQAETVIDAADKIVMPGLVDMHVHLREPGREDKETIKSGTLAALKGGVTSVLTMPNTDLAMDCLENIRLLKSIIKQNACVNVFVCAAITRGRLGKELTDIAAFKKEGVLAISDDGASVDSDTLMANAFKLSRQQKILVICHSEDKILSAHGVVNLGFTSTRLGLRGISKESEFTRVARDIQLAKEAQARVHIAHVSCEESVELIAKAKKQGVEVTAETAPHYLSLTEEALAGYDTNLKVNPPLRSKDDMASLRQALADGTIDVIASDHAPHTENEKDIEFERAEFGSVGLETELAVGISELVHNSILTWPQLVKAMALHPAQILGIERGALSAGSQADIIIVSPDEEWVVNRECLVSKSQNSAFLGKTLKGVVEYSILGGKIAHKR